MATIKVPNNMKSPTVIIVGQQEASEPKNDRTLRRMDNLERKLDQQYKSIINKTDYGKAIMGMQTSFMSNFNKMLAMNKSMMTQAQKEKIDVLRQEFTRKIKSLENNKDKDGNESIKLFTKKLNSLESAIKNITLKPTVVRVRNNNKSLFNAFDGILHRLEGLIRESRPRVFPSPS